MIHCIESIGEWMASNRLALNPLKSEFMWCASPHRTDLIDKSAFVLLDGSVNASSSVRNLGVYFDESLSMTDHVNRLVRSCFYQLRRIRFIRCSLTVASCQLVHHCKDRLLQQYSCWIAKVSDQSHPVDPQRSSVAYPRPLTL